MKYTVMHKFSWSQRICQRIENELLFKTVAYHMSLQPFQSVAILFLSDSFVHL